ncbi:M1 family metallopeptidase [Nocardioides dokdonensis]|uniref:M1 family metallopeptidase n=1 Tax=Nocardioides dokdonensis TaxID=450734 RepID=UPI0012FAC6C0|nr:M1 family metallopeptidase [Nocardioides dokdonensis]
MTVSRALLGPLALVLAVALSGAAGPVAAGLPDGGAGPGSPGIGDPYWPRDGNGGYDVDHYDLDLRYRPGSKQLSGVSTISARSTRALSRFHLDLVGMQVTHVNVDGRPARWDRRGQELRITPRRAISRDTDFAVAVTYAGRPGRAGQGRFDEGWISLPDGAIVAGEPHSATSWFPSNDHPTDRARYTFRIEVPAALSVVANGRLEGTEEHGRTTTWTWRADEPMASYLTTVGIGDYDVTTYEEDGLRFHDAIDAGLPGRLSSPSTGTRLAVARGSNNAYQRLARRIEVPPDGATMAFDLARDTEPGFDFVFVEAHTVGRDDWTTLRDLGGHTSSRTGRQCATWSEERPFIVEHYQSQRRRSCRPVGPTGEWWAASGAGDGIERWEVDLGPYAGSEVEVSITYLTDGSFRGAGVTVDDVEVSAGVGSTSFEGGLEGWTVPGPPEGDAANRTDWRVGSTDDVPAGVGEKARRALARQPEIVRYLSGLFGEYPWRDVGGIVEDSGVGFALETQTRPVYESGFFASVSGGSSLIVHELAHQWFGDSLTVKRWKHIWLNEGFASYTQWLWSEAEGRASAAELAWRSWRSMPQGSDYWDLRIGAPGRDNLFDGAVYNRGALTLHALRVRVGDETFFRILQGWPTARAGQDVTTRQFVRYAERVAGRDLDGLFRRWLFTPKRPDFPGARPSADRRTVRDVPVVAHR